MGNGELLHNKELCVLYSSAGIAVVVKSKRAGHVDQTVNKKCIKNCGGETLGRSRGRQEDYIEMDLEEIGYGLN